MEAHERRALPEGWEWKRLGDVASIIMGQSPPGSTYNERGDGFPFLQGNAEFNDKYPKNIKYTTEPSKIAPKNSILISVRAPVGDTNIANIDYCIGRGLASISLINGDNKYLFYLLNYLKPKIEDKGTGSTFQAISKSVIYDIQIPLPPLPTQLRIVSILEKAEETKRLRAQADGLTDRLLQSVFLELFGDTMKNPKGWEIKNMGTEITDIRYGTGSPPEYQEEGIPFIRATNIKKGTVQKEGLVYISKEEANKIKKCEIKTGDLILVRSGVNTGDCARIPPEYDGAYAGYDLVLQMPYPKNYYYNFIINSDYGKSVIKPLSRRAGQPHINADQVKSMQFPLPIVQLLEKFARIVEKIESIRQSQNQSKQQIEDLFGALMQKAFRGELER